MVSEVQRAIFAMPELAGAVPAIFKPDEAEAPPAEDGSSSDVELVADVAHRPGSGRGGGGGAAAAAAGAAGGRGGEEQQQEDDEDDEAAAMDALVAEAEAQAAAAVAAALAAAAERPRCVIAACGLPDDPIILD